ncbi:hypothetical protein FTX61_07255 [Nitriliruptoraceae bacterium ZYF776]|nr:hypothetical protein [Profundirhabdus halotolerans]
MSPSPTPPGRPVFHRPAGPRLGRAAPGARVTRGARDVAPCRRPAARAARRAARPPHRRPHPQLGPTGSPPPPWHVSS